MKVEVRPAVLEDFVRIRLQDGQKHLQEYTLAEAKEAILPAINRWCYTATVDTRPILVAGIHEGGSAHGVAWAWVSEEVREHAFACIRAIKDVISRYVLTHGAVYCRVQDTHSARRFAKVVGFQKRGAIWRVSRSTLGQKSR